MIYKKYTITLDDYLQYRTNKMHEYILEGSLVDNSFESFFINTFVDNGSNLYIDIGCNIGSFIDLCIRNFPDINILGFEPDKRIFTEHLSPYNEKQNIKIYNEGIYSKNTKLKFFYNSDTTQTSMKYMPGARFHKMDVKKLDYYFNYIKNFENPFIKIDTEGCEPEVIYGMKKIIKYFSRIGILFEYSYKWNYTDKEIYDLFVFLEYNGFEVYRCNTFGIEKIPMCYAHYLKEFHFSNILAIKGFSFKGSKQVRVDSKTGILFMYPIIEEKEVQFKELDELRGTSIT